MQEVQLNGNEFLIVNTYYPHAKLKQWGTEYNDFGTSEGENSPATLWMLEEGTGANHGFFYIKNVKYQGYRLAQYGSAYWQISVFNGPHLVDQLWRFERVTDNLGDEWDYYRIWNKHYKNHRLAKFGTSDTELSVINGALYPDQLWRLVPRYMVKDGGYIQIKRHSG